MKKFAFLCLLAIPMTLLAETQAPDVASSYRFEASASLTRDGESIEVGVITPKLFQFSKSSRHHWSAFATAGAFTVSNVIPQGQTTAEEDIYNLEITAGIFAEAQFYSDFITQYGKVGLDFINYDSKLNSDPAVGGLLESGLEFHSDKAKIPFSDFARPFAVHIGLRWRFGFDGVDQLASQIDPIEGVSFVIGSRLTF